MRGETQSIKRRLQQMDDYDFEHFVADLWERRGWDCEVSQASVDAGIDVTATKSVPYKQKKLIQAKRYGENTTVGGPEIQQYASLKHQQADADSVVVVTSNAFTNSAETRASDLNVKLVDGDDLENLITFLEAHDLLERYNSTPNPADTEPMVGDEIGTANPSGSDTSISSESTPDLRDGDSILSPDSSPEWLRRLERAKQWHRLIPAAIALWFVSLAIAGSLDGMGGVMNGVADLVGYGLVWPLSVAIPTAWYLDMRYVRAETDWSPTFPLYIIANVCTAGLAMVYYYYKRYKTIGL